MKAAEYVEFFLSETKEKSSSQERALRMIAENLASEVLVLAEERNTLSESSVISIIKEIIDKYWAFVRKAETIEEKVANDALHKFSEFLKEKWPEAFDAWMMENGKGYFDQISGRF